MKVLLGGSTNNASMGIYAGDLKTNDSSPQLQNIKNIITVDRPSYFRVAKDLLITIAQKDDQAGIATYLKENNQYEQQDLYFHKGAAPAYIGLDEDNQLIFTANYHLGTLSVFQYNSKGKLTFITETKHTGHGPRPEQDTAHPHFFDRTPGGHLVSCDLGTDTVDFYELQNGALIHLASYQMEKGFGPRHLSFSPNGKTMYIIGELSSQINVVNLNETDWSFNNIGTYKTISNSFTDKNGAAAIRLSSDGKFLYASNRGEDTLVVFKVLPTQKLELVQRISTFGSFPRDFNWDNYQDFVVVANQTTNNATLYRRNSDTGTLTALQKDIYVPEATCVHFL